MRILMLGIALLALSTFAFAQTTANTVVTLNISDFCSITADAATASFTAAGNAVTASQSVGFKYDANKTGTITPTISAAAGNPAGLVWSTGLPVAAVAGKVAEPISFSANVTGITPAILAGSYAATLTATISIP